jgi:hypothetical protein
MYSKIINNEEPVCMDVHTKHGIIKVDYMKQYNSEKTELEKQSKNLTDKVVMVHKTVSSMFPEDIFKIFKSYLFTCGSIVEKELIRIQHMNYYKMKSLTIDRIDELIIHQNIQWGEEEEEIVKEKIE